jgi:hypothetical protein
VRGLGKLDSGDTFQISIARVISDAPLQCKVKAKARLGDRNIFLWYKERSSRNNLYEKQGDGISHHCNGRCRKQVKCRDADPHICIQRFEERRRKDGTAEQEVRNGSLVYGFMPLHESEIVVTVVRSRRRLRIGLASQNSRKIMDYMWTEYAR